MRIGVHNRLMSSETVTDGTFGQSKLENRGTFQSSAIPSKACLKKESLASSKIFASRCRLLSLWLPWRASGAAHPLARSAECHTAQTEPQHGSDLPMEALPLPLRCGGQWRLRNGAPGAGHLLASTCTDPVEMSHVLPRNSKPIQ